MQEAAESGCRFRLPIQPPGSASTRSGSAQLFPAMPLLASFWIAQADALYAVVSTTLLLAVVFLVLRPGHR